MKVVGAYLAFCALLIGGFGLFFYTNPQYLSTNQFIFQDGGAVTIDPLDWPINLETSDCGNTSSGDTISFSPFTDGERRVAFFSTTDEGVGTNTIQIQDEQMDISIDSNCGDTAAVLAYGFTKPQDLEDARQFALNILSYDGDFEVRFFALEVPGLSLGESLALLLEDTSNEDTESLTERFGKGWAFFSKPVSETGDMVMPFDKPVMSNSLSWRNVRLFGIVIYGSGELSFNRPRLIP